MKLKTDKDGKHTLHLNDKAFAVCPFKPVLLIPSAMGNVTQTMQPCSSDCPHFKFMYADIRLHKDSDYVTITCSGAPVDIDIEQEEKPQSKTIIIN